MAVIIIIGGGGGNEVIEAAKMLVDTVQSVSDEFQTLYNKNVVSDADVNLAKQLAAKLGDFAIQIKALDHETRRTLIDIKARCDKHHGRHE